jgi:Rieske 2Fe-2S family protein
VGGAPIAEADILGALERGLTLPAAAYRSDAVFAWEREHLLGGSWFCVGRAGDLAAGDQVGAVVGGEGVLLVRDGSGALKAFHNVCRHRGHELVEAGGRASGGAIHCPYHGWTYGLDGCLLAAARFPDLNRAGFPLRPVRVAEWHGWAFVDVSGMAAELPVHAGGLGDLLAPYDPVSLVPAATSEYVVAANWKLIVENYHECYHCPSIHPELCRVSPPRSGRNFEPAGAWVGGTMDLRDDAETMSLDGRSGSAPLPGLDGEQRRRVLYAGLLPNLLISAHPDYVLSHRLEPLEAGRTRVVCDWLFPPGDVDPAYAVDFWDVTNRQDWRACESVHRGLGSRAHAPGPLAPCEDAVQRFVEYVARAYR